MKTEISNIKNKIDHIISISRLRYGHGESTIKKENVLGDRLIFFKNRENIKRRELRAAVNKKKTPFTVHKQQNFS